MKIERLVLKSETDFSKLKSLEITPHLFLIFGEGANLCNPHFIDVLDECYPNAIRFGCSSSGEISQIEVFDHTIIVTAVEFEKSKVICESLLLNGVNRSEIVGEELMKKIPKHNLKHLMVLSDGININGVELIAGIQKFLPEGVAVTGGLAGDGDRFQNTYVFNSEGKPVKNCISILGFYGDTLTFGYGSKGGWDSFGMERMVTKSRKNILYELDGQPALEVYKHYLGHKAKDLPASALLFPLCLRERADQEPVVRTILGVNEKEQSLTFAGNIPEGSYVKLMKANADRLIDGAELSALASSEMLPKGEAELAILISCVGRKLVLKQLVEEEVEAVADIIGLETWITGFYSYGEISPFKKDMPTLLHNQTMTITTISEK